jgi:hypothetical protein
MLVEEKKSPNLLMDHETLDQPILTTSLYDGHYGVLDSHKTTRLIDLYMTIDEVVTDDSIIGFGDTSKTTEFINSGPAKIVTAPKNPREL